MRRKSKNARSIVVSTRSSEQLGQAISRFRKAADLTQIQLAKRAGLRQATISKAERGGENTEIKTIYAICAALGLELVIQNRESDSEEEFYPEDIFS